MSLCYTDSDCSRGHSCNQGFCQQRSLNSPCDSKSTCPSPLVCGLNNRCMLHHQKSTRAVPLGGYCLSQADCSGEHFCDRLRDRVCHELIKEGESCFHAVSHCAAGMKCHEGKCARYCIKSRPQCASDELCIHDQYTRGINSLKIGICWKQNDSFGNFKGFPKPSLNEFKLPEMPDMPKMPLSPGFEIPPDTSHSIPSDQFTASVSEFYNTLNEAKFDNAPCATEFDTTSSETEFDDAPCATEFDTTSAYESTEPFDSEIKKPLPPKVNDPFPPQKSFDSPFEDESSSFPPPPVSPERPSNSTSYSTPEWPNQHGWISQSVIIFMLLVAIPAIVLALYIWFKYKRSNQQSNGRDDTWIHQVPTSPGDFVSYPTTPPPSYDEVVRQVEIKSSTSLTRIN